MLPRAIELVFATAAETTALDGSTFAFELAYLEVYNEALVDLLDPTSCKKLEVRTGAGDRPYVASLRLQVVADVAALLAAVGQAQERRSFGSTQCNERKSPLDP